MPTPSNQNPWTLHPVVPTSPAGAVVRPGKNPVKFGNITFSTEECPDLLPIGAAEQMVAAHNLPGGGKILNKYGNKPKDVSWTARFWGPNIWPRVQQCRAYQVNGTEELFSYWNELYYGVMTSFDPGYKGGYNEYQITVQITRDANGAFTIASATSLDQQVAALQGQMISVNSDILSLDDAGATAFQSYLKQVQSSIAAASPIAKSPASLVQNVISAIAAAHLAVGVYQASLNETLPQFISTIALGSTLTSLQNLITSGEFPATASIQGGSLFGLATAQYNDPSQAFAIAAANGLRVPFVTQTIAQELALPSGQ